ncbi:MAG: epoxyqueuosine reductase QueH [Patescibacteria group bacterium]|nr:epoxyqueuosine reductase QueH [Patescibacteria group bacterium]
MPIKLLLHVCCAPCSIAVIDELRSKYVLTVFFYNPNIYPEAEYLKRKAEVVRVCDEWQISMVDADYESTKWDKAVAGLEHEPEMGERCPVCFGLRLRRTAEYAAQHGFSLFATSLTMGRNKKAEVINPIGWALADEFGIKFYPEDWKKSGRQIKAKKLVEERGIYRQNYCGCRYSQKKTVIRKQ